MPLIARVIDSYVDLAPEIRGDPNKRLNTVTISHISNMTGILGQLRQLTEHATDIFDGLIECCVQTSSRLEKVSSNVDRAVEHLYLLDQAIKSDSKPPETIKTAHSTKDDSSPPSMQRLMSKAIQHQYEQCNPPPALNTLDKFTGGEGSCMKKYSDPFFFIEEWMKEEALRQAKALEEKKERRQRRKEQKMKLKNASMINQDGEEPMSEQRQRLLAIRSWRDKFGYGEGSELAGKRGSGEAKSETATFKSPPKLPPPPVPPMEEPQSPPPPPPPPPITDEESDSDEAESPIPPPPESPPPSLEVTVDEKEEIEAEQILSPVPPPPIPMIERPPSPIKAIGLLGEIQAGKKLRSAKEIPRPKALNGPTKMPNINDLMTDIRNSNALRHVEQDPLKRKNSRILANATSISNVISEILARRTVIAYDTSDSESDSDAEWKN